MFTKPKYIYKCTIGNKNIKYRPWSTKEEKDFLILKETEDSVNSQDIFDTLIKPCLDKEYNLDTNEQKYMLVQIRKVSIGETFPLTFTCPECKEVNEQEVLLDNAIKFTPNNYKPIELESSTVYIGDCTKKGLERIQEAETDIERAFIELVVSIKKVQTDDEIYEAFTFEEMYNEIESMESKEFEKLMKEFNKMKSSFNIEFSCSCLKCSKEKEFKLTSIPNFLWL